MSEVCEKNETCERYQEKPIDEILAEEEDDLGADTMEECWLIHPIDDEDCLPCPDVEICRAIRKDAL